MRYSEVKAVGNYVVLKGEMAKEKEEVVTEGGIVLTGEATSAANSSGQRVNTNSGKVRIKPPIVYSIGPKVSKEELGIEIGDRVICNDYDVHSFTDDDGEFIWIVCKDTSIQTVIKTEE